MLDLEKIIANETKKVEPLLAVGATPVYSFEDAQKLNELELTDRKLHGKKIDLTDRQVTADGMTYTSTGKKNTAVNVDTFLNNRYRKHTETIPGEKKDEVITIVYYDVVVDKRAIFEQDSGLIYSNNVTAYRIGQDEDNNLIVNSILTIKADDFVNDFKGRLDNKSSMQIYELISNSQEMVTDYDKMEF